MSALNTLTNNHEQKACGSCTMCCKVYDVPELNKLSGHWCSYVAQGRGCKIYETRPKLCRDFFCNWIYVGELGPEWKPDKSRLVITTDPVSRNILIEVDPGLPNAWRKEPYYSTIKQWSSFLIKERRHVAISIRKSLTIILPDGEVYIGRLQDSEIMHFQYTPQENGTKVNITKRQR